MFRDKRRKAKELGINTHIIFYNLKIDKIKKYKLSRIRYHAPSLKRLGPLEKMSVFILDGNLHEHSYLKKELKVIKKFKVIDD